jgi:hypothetical protein
VRLRTFSARFAALATFHPTARELDGNSVVIQQAGAEKCVLAVGQHDSHGSRVVEEPHRPGKHEFHFSGAIGKFDDLFANEIQSKLHGEANGQTEIAIESGVNDRCYRDRFPGADYLSLCDGRHAVYLP